VTADHRQSKNKDELTGRMRPVFVINYPRIIYLSLSRVERGIIPE